MQKTLDELKLYDLLKTDHAAYLITGASSHHWGTEQVFYCEFDPLGNEIPFQMTFKGCTVCHWNFDAELDESDTAADVIATRIEEHAASHQIIITTDIFEVRIQYSELIIQLG